MSACLSSVSRKVSFLCRWQKTWLCADQDRSTTKSRSQDDVGPDCCLERESMISEQENYRVPTNIIYLLDERSFKVVWILRRISLLIQRRFLTPNRNPQESRVKSNTSISAPVQVSFSHCDSSFQSKAFFESERWLPLCP